jgi:hypothetical protein
MHSGFEPEGIKGPELETGIVATYMSKKRSQGTLVPGGKEFGMPNEHEGNALGSPNVSGSASFERPD